MKNKASYFILVALLIGFFFSPSLSGQELANQLVGTFKGKLRNQTIEVNDYEIKVVRVDSTKIRIEPLTGSQSQTVVIELTEQTMGSVTIIKFKMPTDHLFNNGMYVNENGRISYGLFLGGTDPRNIEIFTGKKQ